MLEVDYTEKLQKKSGVYCHQVPKLRGSPEAPERLMALPEAVLHLAEAGQQIPLKLLARLPEAIFEVRIGGDATRVRALKIFKRHTISNAIDFINYIVKKFPFRIRTIRTNRVTSSSRVPGALPLARGRPGWSTSTSNRARLSSPVRSSDPEPVNADETLDCLI